MSDTLSLESINEFLDNEKADLLIHKKTEEYEEKLKKIENIKEKIEILEKRVGELDSEIEKKKQEFESLQGSENLADKIIAVRQYESLVEEHENVVSEALIYFLAIDVLISKLKKLN